MRGTKLCFFVLPLLHIAGGLKHILYCVIFIFCVLNCFIFIAFLLHLVSFYVAGIFLPFLMKNATTKYFTITTANPILIKSLMMSGAVGNNRYWTKKIFLGKNINFLWLIAVKEQIVHLIWLCIYNIKLCPHGGL